jgi:hypothetical protein
MTIPTDLAPVVEYTSGMLHIPELESSSYTMQKYVQQKSKKAGAFGPAGERGPRGVVAEWESEEHGHPSGEPVVGR